MQRNVARRATAAALALGFAGLAQAVPLYFDFTGTVVGETVPPMDGGEVGNAVSGGFTFETDRLFPTSPAPLGDGFQHTFVDWQPTGLTEPFAFLNFGGRSLTWPNYESNYSLISFGEACSPSGCAPQTGENFNLQAHSQDIWNPDFTGTMHSSFLFFMSAAQTRIPDFPFFEYFNYFDPEDIVPTAIVTLPLYDLVGVYAETVSSCVAGACTTIEDRQFGFSIDSVSRGEGPRSVPEPGTIGLLGAALFLCFALRRRQEMFR
jgi:hypothetical protein